MPKIAPTTVLIAEAPTAHAPFIGPLWPDNTFNCGDTFWFGGEPVARLDHCFCPDHVGKCGADFGEREVIFEIEPGFYNPTVDKLATVFQILRNHPDAAIPEALTGIHPADQPEPVTDWRSLLSAKLSMQEVYSMLSRRSWDRRETKGDDL